MFYIVGINWKKKFATLEKQNTAKSMIKSAPFQIPINEFDSVVCEEAAKEKNNEILEFITNHNEINSYEEFSIIKRMIRQAFSRGDLELLEIYLSKEIEINTEMERLTFKIDKNRKTVSLFKVLKSQNCLIVPRTIEYEGEEYLVTSVISSGGCCKQIKRILFPSNSAVQTIYEESFSGSKIENIFFQPSLIELKEGWCANTDKLNKIIISKSNNRFLFKDDKYLIGKSDNRNEDFDILLFARRDIVEAQIQSNIKIVSSYAFSGCTNLSKVEISTDSNLQIIEEYAFSHTGITEISIPPNVSTICDNAFCGCYQLSKVEIPVNSNLKTIGNFAFADSKITEIYFPSSLIELKENWCFSTRQLNKITISESNNRFLFKDDKYLLGKSDNKNDDFDIFLFACRDIEEIQIPSNIKIISKNAFSFCKQISKVEISADSNLQIIEEYALSFLKITEISIPPNVSTICDNAFCGCMQLSKVEIPVNSNLKTIGNFAFADSKITEIYFPSSLIELKENWCFGTKLLNKIIISESNNRFLFKDDKYLLGKSDNKNDDFDILLFARRDIEEVQIPSNIKIITSLAFNGCKNLSKVEISTDSNLQTIGKTAFLFLGIREIYIPPNVSMICDSTFYNCNRLSKVEISANSNLEKIGELAFQASSITEIFIPSNVSKICDSAFKDCKQLSKVEIPTNSNLQTFGKYAFSNTKITSFYIPSNVSTIHDSVFNLCRNLQIVEISEESKLHSLDKTIFGLNCHNIVVMIPQKARKVINLNNDH